MKVFRWSQRSGTAHWWLLAAVLLSTLAQCRATQQLTLREECANGTFVGNVQVPEALRERVSSLRLIEYPPDLFTLRGTAIFTKTRVDREALCRANLRSARCLVHISVNAEPAGLQMPRIAVLIEDVNDNAPHFPDSNEYVLGLSESLSPNTSDSEFELPLASDDDQQFGVQNYRLLERTDEFSLQVQRNRDAEIERVTLALRKPLDRENKDSYQLRVIAFDSADRQYKANTATLTVRVNVIDANDHRPVFQKALYRAAIPEDFSLQTTFLTVHAKDLDAELNSELHYDFAPSASRTIREKFTVESDSGELRLKDLLDYETQRSYLIPLIACDQAQPPLCGNTTVEVTLTDVNDEAPSIAVAYENDAHSVNESARIGTIVAFATVTDRDSGASGIHGVKCTTDNNRFTLATRAGAAVDNVTVEYNVLTATALDREGLHQDLEHASVFQEVIGIVCEDSGDRKLVHTTAITLTVLDANDNAPKFLMDGLPVSHVETNVLENEPSGTPLLTVVAYDADAGENARVTYSLLGFNQELFAVDPVTGKVTTRRELDRESAQIYNLNVSACDNGFVRLCSSLLLTVNVEDVNDCAPRVISNTDFSVRESHSVNTAIGKLEAIDCDALMTSQTFSFQMELSSLLEDDGPIGLSSAEVFSVEHNGLIRLLKPLDREIRDSYVLPVRVLDGGSPRRSQLLNVTVRVLDENDNDPRVLIVGKALFPVVNNTVVVSFQEPAGTTICQVHASDADEDASAQHVTFAVRSGDQQDLFYLNEFTGELSLKRQPGAELIASSYQLLVEANDGTRRGSALLTVMFDNGPSRSVYSHSVMSRETQGESLFSMKSILIICICIMILVLVLSLFAFVYVKYCHSEEHKRNDPSNKLKQKSLAHQNASRRRCEVSYVRPTRASCQKDGTMVAALGSPSCVSSECDGHLHQCNTSEHTLCRVSHNTLNQLGPHSFESGSTNEYAALDQLGDSRYRQLSTFLCSSNFAYGHAATLAHDHSAAARSMMSFKKQRSGCECGVHVIGEDTDWHQAAFACGPQLESQTSRTVSHNQDGSSVLSGHDESSSDNNVALMERLCNELDCGVDCKPTFSKQSSAESRAFSVGHDHEPMRLLRHKRPAALNQYDPRTELTYSQTDAADKLLSFANCCAHTPTVANFCPTPHCSTLTHVTDSKRSAPLLASQLSTETASKRTPFLVTARSVSSPEQDHLLMESEWSDTHNNEMRTEDLNANKVADVNTNRTPTRSRNAPETSYV